jgi:hypothetical protein
MAMELALVHVLYICVSVLCCAAEVAFFFNIYFLF